MIVTYKNLVLTAKLAEPIPKIATKNILRCIKSVLKSEIECKNVKLSAKKV